MDRWLYVHRNVRGVPRDVKRALRTRLSTLLADEDLQHAVDGSFLMALHGEYAGLGVTKRVRVHVGAVRDRPGGMKIPVTWEADPMPEAFPTFDGFIEFERLSARHGQLSLVGRYRPPLGPLGAAGDALVLQQQAVSTAENLIRRLGDRLFAEACAEKHTEPVAAMQLSSGAMTVADVMSRDPVVLDPDMPLRTAALLLFHLDISGAPVMAADGELIGVLSEADVIEKQATPPYGWRRGTARAWERHDAVTVGQACSRPAKSTHPDASLHAVARKMVDEDIARLVVLRDADMVGIITRHDVLRALLRSDGEMQGAIEEELAHINEHDVEVDVEWGVVTLSGMVSARSRGRELQTRIAGMDGVMAIDADDLGWHADDVLGVPGGPVGSPTRRSPR